MPFELSHFKFNPKTYAKYQADALKNPDKFWENEARKRIDWHRPFTEISDVSFSAEDLHIQWFSDGTLNASYNALDRHCLTQPDKTALIWESNCGKMTKHYSFEQLKHETEIFTAVLRAMGVKENDSVAIYLPMIPEAVIAMLACSRIGAVHCVVFGGFSSSALETRILDCQASFIITADEGRRGDKIIPLKKNVDEALKNCPQMRQCLVIQHTNNLDVPYHDIDIKYNDIKNSVNVADGYYQIVSSEHPLFILYTSGSTGKPKGLVHTTGGYCVYSSFTHELSFNLHPDDVFFCTADVGWITGHSYLTYGPLINGTTILLYEGIPTYPNASRFWELCDKHKVSIFYTAPTALRTLMGFGDDLITPYDLSSLRVLGTVGEPINPEVYEWYARVIGKNRCPIVDTWWQTETGGHMIACPANLATAPAGFAGMAYPAIDIDIVTPEGVSISKPHEQGYLVIKNSWPGQARTIQGNHKRFIDTYFSEIPNMYLTGDGAYRDSQGHIRITGRIDDVLNVSGHRLGTAELESALVAYESVSEAAVVGFDHPIKGQAIYAFVTLMQDKQSTVELNDILKQHIRKEIGAIAVPDFIQFTDDLPKTRSGKIMRRILKKIAEQNYDDFGDITTLANPDIVEIISEESKNVRNVK